MLLQAFRLGAVLGGLFCFAQIGFVDASDGPDSEAFHPRAYPKSVATCSAFNRREEIDTTIAIHYVDVNPEAKRTLVFVHGWPSLWNTWKYQIKEFEKDYRIIAPDNRGFGPSTHPADVQTSGTWPDMVGDLTCVLEHAGVQKAVCVGHDWGAQVCWEAARSRPDIFEAVAVAVVPYIQASGPFVPVSALVPSFPRLAYQLYFERNTTVATEELDADIRRTLRATIRGVANPPPPEFLTSTSSYMYGWNNKTIPPISFFSEEEEDYIVQQYEIQGFQYTLEFYTYGNRYGSWEFAHNQGNITIPQPALQILPTEDPVGDWVKAAKILNSDKFVPNLRTETVVASHWPQLDKPVEFNGFLRSWLENLPAPGADSDNVPESKPEPGSQKEGTQARLADEL